MKSIIIAPSYWENIGGVEAHTLDLFNILNKNKLKPTLICCDNHKSIQKNNTYVFKTIYLLRNYPLPNKHFILTLIKLLKSKEFHICIIQGRHFLTSILGAILCKLFGIKYVYIEHGFEYNSLKSKIFKLLAVLLDHMLFFLVPIFANEIVFVSKTTSVKFKSKFRFLHLYKKHSVIENVAPFIKPLRAKVKKVVFAARYTPQKNNDFVLENFYSLAKMYPKWEFIWVSDHRPKLNPPNNLKIYSEMLTKKEFQNLIDESSIYVNASFYEGLSLSILEADMLNNILVLSNIKENKIELSNKTFYFDPHLSDDFINAVRNAIDESKSVKPTKKGECSNKIVKQKSIDKTKQSREIYSKKYLDLISKY